MKYIHTIVNLVNFCTNADRTILESRRVVGHGNEFPE